MKQDAEKLKPDEPAMWLREYDKHTPHFGDQRMQEIMVVRNGEFSVFETRLGSSVGYIQPGFIIPCGLVLGSGRIESYHTVGEVMELAENAREMPLTEDTIKFFEEADEVFIEDMNIGLEESRSRLVNQSSFGPLQRTQRNTLDRHINAR